MKVVLDTSVVLGEGQSSFRYFSELIPRLKKSIDVSLELLPSPYFNLPKDWYPEKPAYQPLIPKAPWLPPGEVRTLLSKWKSSIENYRKKKSLFKETDQTLFHSFYYSTPPQSGVPLVSVAHDATLEKLSSELQIEMTEHLEKKRKSLLLAQRVIAVSHATKKDMMEFYGIDPKKIDVIPHACSSDFFPEKRETALVTGPYLLQVGGRMHHRNFKNLLEAFSLLSFDIRLICAGEPWSNEELKLIKQWGLENKVELVKNPVASVLRNLYQNAKMLVYPSLYEGFGFPLVEAMACGTPVATSLNAGSIPEVAGEAALYFDPRDPADIAKKMEELLNPEVSKKYIEKGFENLKRFSWDETAKKTLDCYRKVFSA